MHALHQRRLRSGERITTMIKMAVVAWLEAHGAPPAQRVAEAHEEARR
jgi:hypothetical protein